MSLTAETLGLESAVQIDQLWSKTDAVFRSDVSDDVADIWLSQLTAARFDDNVLYLTGSDRARSWVELRYRRALSNCASRAYGAPVEVRLVEAGELPAEAGAAQQESSAPEWHTSPLNPRYSFEQFVIGRSNHIGHAAALAVAEQPAQAFNPLFIYGAPGVGKTHLLHAIGNFLAAQAPDMRVRYLTAENFAAIFRSVVLTNSIQGFKEDLRQTDVLLIDDVQFLLGNKVKTEEEFFHTFNHLHESGRQLVITCDRTPRELDSLADRLRERFESGLVVEIEKPEARLRKAILSKRVHVDRIPLDCDLALARIAERAPANVRSLEGALIRVSAFASMRGEPVTLELVDELLDALHPHTAGAPIVEPATAPVSIDSIVGVVADHFELTLDELLGPGRARRVSGPRQIAMFLACEYSGRSLPEIASAFKRDHSTVVHARDKVRSARRNDPTASEAVDSLKALIHSGGGPVHTDG
jgi:chromosomal replication initiator protein